MSAFFKHIHIIINPISGSDFPILPHLVRILDKHQIEWDIFITKSDEHTRELTQSAIRKNVDAVAVYGGDGTLMTVAAELAGTDVPLIIIPGGTANVLAKELGIPIVEGESIKVFGKGRPKTLLLDIGICNTKPFVLRVNVGIFADMVKHASRESKDSLGQLSYALTALERLSKVKPSTYKMELDGKKVEEEGIGLLVANSGNVGISGLTLSKDIKVDDGFLDVLVFKSADIATIMTVLKGMLAKKKPESTQSFVHYKIKKAKISINPAQSVIRDDLVIDVSRLDILVKPKKLKVLL